LVTITGPGAVLEAIHYFGAELGPALGIKSPRDHAWHAARSTMDAE
jgi:hypothetical protein